MTEQQYRAHPGINISALKAFKRSPLHAKHGFEEEREATDAMKIGSLLDHRVLGTDYLWTTSPFDDFRTKEARAWRDDQDHRGVTVFKQDEIERVDGMVASLRVHPVATRFLSQGTPQKVLIARYESPSNKVCDRKGMIDWAPDHIPVLVDLKKTCNASPFAFSRQVADLCYHAQAAYYLDLWKHAFMQERGWVWVCVEDKAPYAVAVYTASAEMLDVGEKLWRSWLNQWLECSDTGSWPGYNGDDITKLDLPRWAKEGE
jgi:hypothetical protein